LESFIVSAVWGVGAAGAVGGGGLGGKSSSSSSKRAASSGSMPAVPVAAADPQVPQPPCVDGEDKEPRPVDPSPTMAGGRSIMDAIAQRIRGVKESADRTHKAYIKPVKRAVREEFKSERMKSLLCSPYVFWRHPIARIFIVWIILVEDFFIYGEDPVNDSRVRANFPGMGHILGLITLHTADSVGLGFLKFFLVLVAFIVGFALGRLFLVRIIRARWKVVAFEGCEGAILTVSLFITGMLMLCSLLYNVMIPSDAEALGGHSMDIFLLFGAKTLQYRHVNKNFQTLSGSVDLLAILMVMDQVLQDNHWYPNFAPYTKKFWLAYNGWVRIIAFWVLLIGGIAICAVGVSGTGTEPGEVTWNNKILGGTSEVTRGILAACIVFTDLFTVAQDWAFPTFRDNLEIEVPKIAGTAVETLRISWMVSLIEYCPPLPESVRKWMPPADFFQLSFTGKWLTYGPLIGVMIIDLFCTKTQLMYNPSDYGQYVDPFDNCIMLIVDEDYLNIAYSEDGTLVDESMITWEARWNATTGQALSASALTDIKLNSKYVDSSVKYFGLILALVFIAIFVATIMITNYRLRKGLPVDMYEEDGSPIASPRDAQGAETSPASLPSPLKPTVRETQ